MSPLGGVYLSFELNWEECRRHDLIFNKILKTAKRGFLRLKISRDYLNILISIVRINFVYSTLIYNLLAPLFRRMRATFSQFELELKFSPMSAKTFYFPTRLFYGGKCPPSAEYI